MEGLFGNDSVYILWVTDIDGDERYEGTYSTQEAAQEAAMYLKEWDITMATYRIQEDLIRENGSD